VTVKQESQHPLLSFDAVGHSYGAVKAVEHVSFVVNAGEVVAVVGDNGAGKSTLMNLASGVFSPSEGTVALDGKPLSLRSPSDAQQLGIETIYQDMAICKNLDAAANIFLGRELRRGRMPFSRLDYPSMRRTALATIEKLDIVLKDPDAPVSTLSGGQQKAVAIARAVHWQARLVIMDEPSAALGVPEQRKVAELIDTLRTNGLGVILVSHSMPEVFETSDRIVVMRRGRKVADVPRSEITPEECVNLMVGNGTRLPEVAA
jgi:simple sugar transport system ATP-binding protein